MIQISSIPAQGFSEVPQKAPLRWSVLYVEQDGKAQGQHGWWKCKDFLNDSVIYLNTGRKFSVYGYPNTLKLNEGLSYVALKNVPGFFADNLVVLNEWLTGRGFPAIGRHEHDKGSSVDEVISIPALYWGNTFLISVITSLIRSCVYAKASTIDALVANESTLSGYWAKVQQCMTMENVPKMNELLFKNYQYSKKDVMTAGESTIHNAGLQTWIDSGAF